MKARPIQVVPDDATSQKIEIVRGQLRTSRAGLTALAIDFVLPLLESGKARVVNGRVEFLPDPQHVTAA